VLVLPVPCVVLPAAHLLQRSAALLLRAAKPALKWPLGHLAVVRLVEPAAERYRPGGTTAHSRSNASRHGFCRAASDDSSTRYETLAGSSLGVSN
jgi:hypothetical protein